MSRPGRILEICSKNSSRAAHSFPATKTPLGKGNARHIFAEPSRVDANYYGISIKEPTAMGGNQ